MTELEKKIHAIISRPQLAGFATIGKENKPWVRYVVARAGKDMTIRIATSAKSRKVSQIKENPEVHLNCGVSSPLDMKPYLQIQGTAEVCTNQKVKDEYWYPQLGNIFKGGREDPDYAVILVTPYRIEFTPPGSFKPEVWIKKQDQ